MNSKLKPAVGYIRMSIDQQQDSPERQRRDIKSMAVQSNYKIIKWYEDHGQTGTESSKRKEFQKLLVDAKTGSFVAVLLSEQGRMSREDIFDCMQHWRLFRDAGVAIVTCPRGYVVFFPELCRTCVVAPSITTLYHNPHRDCLSRPRMCRASNQTRWR